MIAASLCDDHYQKLANKCIDPLPKNILNVQVHSAFYRIHACLGNVIAGACMYYTTSRLYRLFV